LHADCDEFYLQERSARNPISPERRPMSHPPRRIDHAVFAVRDLEAAALFYRRLGFQVGARNRHPWGTENRLIQLGTSFIELITVGPAAAAIPDFEPGRFSFGAFVRDYLSRREGFAMLALQSEDAKADAASFCREGLGAFEPFSFERTGRRPDGSEAPLAFTLAFAQPPGAPSVGFFTCQHHFPQNFWNPLLQRHENGASAIAEVGLISAHPQRYQDFLCALSRSCAVRDERGGLSIRLRDTRLTVASAEPAEADLQLHSVTIRVPDLSAQADRLEKGEVGFAASRTGLAIPAESAFGVAIRLESRDLSAS
jgi:catechol 2,3-dioxygenase-like lactoylglutathione lyase family enzyme